jgi:formylglycine-generating enzyme required for sulfatase activity
VAIQICFPTRWGLLCLEFLNKHCAFGFVIIGLVFGSFSPAAAQSDQAGRQRKIINRYALLIGVDDYANCAKLSYCGADQKELREELVRSGFVPDRVVLLHDRADENRYRPSKGNIERQLDIVSKLAGEDDLLILAFSGHGVQINKQTYICPNDCMLDDENTLVSIDSISERLNRCKASLKVLIVDACRNQASLPGEKSTKARQNSWQIAGNLQTTELPRGLVMYNSCAPDEVSRESADLRHSVFMYFLLQGMRGEADADRNGFVSLRELQLYASVKTKDHVAKQYNDSQVPFFRADVQADALEYGLIPVGLPQVITNSIGMKFTLIPAGEFMMGNGETPDATVEFAKQTEWKNKPTREAFTGEYPQHFVQISQPFYMGIYEVKVSEFRQFVERTGYKTEAERDGFGGTGVLLDVTPTHRDPKFNWKTWGTNQSDNHPVVNLTWNDCSRFCEWLSKTESKRYRLPSEAEWEYACRARSKTRFFFGDDPAKLTQFGNIADKALKSKWAELKGSETSDHYAMTCPVGQFPGNAFGLYDMHGNAWEWCADWYGEDYYSHSSARDPTGPQSGTYRVARGGSWCNSPTSCRTAHREPLEPSSRYNFLSFRVICTNR